MIYVKINEITYPSSVVGHCPDSGWDNRDAKYITLTMDASAAKALFTDGVAWSIVMDVTQPDGTAAQETYDDSAYSVAGDVVDHRDGTVTVKMGMPTDLELAYESLYGGDAQ